MENLKIECIYFNKLERVHLDKWDTHPITLNAKGAHYMTTFSDEAIDMT